MLALLKRTRTGFTLAMIGLLCLSIMSPVLASANNDLVPGDDAVVSAATTLYSDYSYASEVKAEVAEGTPVTITDGPFTATDGSLWYYVQVWDLGGYMPALDLTGAGTTEEPLTTDDASEEEEVSALPWQEPISYGVADDNVKCRSAASTSADEITQFSAGQTVEITGEETWAEGISWILVNCAGVGGYVATDFISVGNETTEEETTVPQTEETTVEKTTEVTESEVVVEETQVETEAVETEEGVEETATEVPALPWQEPINTAFATDNVVCRGDASTSAAPIFTVAADETVEVTGAPIQAEGLSWTPVNCGSVGGYVASDFITTAPAEEFEASDATEEVVEETPTEVVDNEASTDEMAGTEEATEEVVETEAAEETQEATDASQADSTVEEAKSNLPNADEIIDETERQLDEQLADELGTETETATASATEESTEFATEAVTEQPTYEESQPDSIVEEANSNVPNADEVVDETEQRLDEEFGDAFGTETATETGTEQPEVTETEVDYEPQEATEVVDEELNEEGVDDEENSGNAVEETASTSPVDDSDIIGTAEVRGTNGEGVACRTAPDSTSSVIRVLPEDMNVFVLSEPDANGWMSIVCADQVGYAQSTYMYSGGAEDDFDINQSSNAYVSNTGGAGLNCRSGPSLNSSVIGYFPAGSAVNVRGSAEGSWVPVVCGGSHGYVHIDYLSTNGGGSTDSGSNDDSSNTSGSGGSVTVTGTNGDGLRCRTGPGAGNSIIMVMAEDTTVPVRGSAEGSWLPITCAGMDGWAHTDYLGSADGSSGSDSGSNNNEDTGSNSGGEGGTVTVSGTGGASLNCRTGAGTSNNIITSVPEGTVLDTRGGASGGWQPVVCNGRDGYVSTDYITAGGDSSGNSNLSPEPEPEPEPAPSGLGNGDHARTTANLNLRYEPSSGAGIATYAPAGTVVLITGGHAGNGYYPVNWDGLKGFMHGDWLTETNEALSERGGSGSPSEPPPSDGGSGTATGNAIVDYALGYVGYPYVWATHGPASFDCSGFTYWVIKNVVGKDIGYGLWTQVSAGTPVSKSDMLPGDLAFFENTYKAGLSHVGIYIGNGQFVHAQNEATGVVVSDLNSNYYGSRWYGAVRIR